MQRATTRNEMDSGDHLGTAFRRRLRAVKMFTREVYVNERDDRPEWQTPFA